MVVASTFLSKKLRDPLEALVLYFFGRFCRSNRKTSETVGDGTKKATYLGNCFTN